MTTPKKKRGRPTGGKHPEVIRQYWKQMQQAHRQIKKNLKENKHK